MDKSDVASNVTDRAAAVAAEGMQLDEEALSALETAAGAFEFDTELLKTAPARDMRLKIREVVERLSASDHAEFLQKQGMFARFTGADVEARLKFELSGQSVVEKMDELRRAARNALQARNLLQQAKTDLHGEQERLERVIDDARSRLSRADGGDDFLRARFERRLSNIMAVHVANINTIKQIELAVQVLTTLLDRFVDVDTALFPLWQRNVLALAQAEAGERRQAALTLEESKGDLINYLQGDDKS